MKSVTSALVSMLVVTFSHADVSLHCPSPTELPPAKLSILSFRNPTGQWISKVNFTHGTPGNAGVWDINLMQEKVSCGDGGELVTTLLTLTSVPVDNILTLQDSQQVPPQNTTIKPGYKEIPGVSIFKLHTTAKTREQAGKICSQEGTHLAIINSDGEAKRYKNFVANHSRLSGRTDNNYFFLGFQYSETQKKFVTVLGNELGNVGYAVWGNNQPSNIGNSDFRCGGMDRTGKLHDVNCDAKLVFFCEQ
ncbi:hypothetical protein PR048_001782 [Dryococelus australis]|uniref:C-type lectin domain-containing protein n=1 Tax=Dryococelus australis TaxID=614101 RepID=A0ABQ9IKT9_9NEOP|nr:hypothetical protein PR048_001782 [Dryococelus australis]